MRFDKLKIYSEEGNKEISFSKKTLIYSKENSVGKSTLLRILFYSLGYPIPSTYKMKFDKLNTELEYSQGEEKYLVTRKDKYLELSKNGTIIFDTVVVDDMTEWFSYIWKIESPAILNNILGAIYMDQDKGWTLLNRGKVIGNIRFNIRDLLVGLSHNENVERKIEESNTLKKMISETKKILEITDISESRKNEKSLADIKIDEDKLKNLNNLNIQKTFLENKIKKARKQYYENNGLRKYILGLNLMIKNPDNFHEAIIVNESNLLNFDDNLDYLRSQITMINVDLKNVKKKIDVIENNINENTMSLFQTDDILDSTLDALGSIKINKKLLSLKKDELGKRINQLNKEIDFDFENNNELIMETKEWINKFAEILGIKDVVQKHQYLFTRDLKSISGTIYYKVVFSFKMAYIKVIESHTNIKLPIVLDSPSGREVDENNINIIINILNEYFADNQIIIASINDYSIKGLKLIELKNRIFS